MRLLFLNHNIAWSGGTFFRAFHFARHLVKRGHHVTVVAISRCNRWQFTTTIEDGVKLIQTPDFLWGRGRTGWDPWDTFQRILFARRSSWDLVHAFDSRPAVILPAVVLQQRGISLVLDWADWWGRGGTINERTTGRLVRTLGPVETWFEEAFRTRAQGTTVISSTLRRRAISLGVPPESIALILNGADIEQVPVLPRQACRRSLSLPEHMPIVCYLGTLNRSDAQLLFDTFNRLVASRPDCWLLLIGKHQAVVPKHPNILQTGHVTQEKLLQYLGACDLGLLPMKDTVASRGRWPSKVGDYLAAGKPVVSTRVGDVAALIEEGQCGVLTDDTPEDFASKILDLLRHPDWIDQMGWNARKVAETKLDWRLLTDQLEQFYLRVMNA